MPATNFFVVPAPGHYGDRAVVMSSHATLAAARRAAGREYKYSVRVGALTKGSEWLRAWEGVYPLAEESARTPFTHPGDFKVPAALEAPAKPALSAPSIHLNGSSADALIEQLTGAGRALRDALRALDDAAPNARDYYLQGDGDEFGKAMREHLSRVERVRSVMEEITSIDEHVMEACEERARFRGGK